VRLNLPDRFFDFLPWVAGTLLIAGIVHIVSVLLMPAVAPRTAYARVLQAVGDAPVDQLVPLPVAAPGAEPLPFEDPAFAEGVCVYDLSKGLLRVTTPADGENFLALSFLSSGGRLYHAITDRAAIKGKINIVVADEKQMETLQSVGDEASPQEVRLTSPSKRGLVLIRAFAKRETELARARERLNQVTCARVDAPKD
jgi:uncharacterized membrane protein